jgi:hypothetical protein
MRFDLKLDHAGRCISQVRLFRLRIHGMAPSESAESMGTIVESKLTQSSWAMKRFCGMECFHRDVIVRGGSPVRVRSAEYILSVHNRAPF